MHVSLRRCASASLLLVYGIVACGGGDGGAAGSAPLQQQGQLSSASGLDVTASIAAVSLGDECGGGAPASDFAGKCAPGAPCASTCQPSNVQLVFVTGATGQSAHVAISAVTLHDGNGAQIDTLSPTNPESWTGNAYAAWNETLAPSANLKASYALSAPHWSKVDNGKASYSAKYTVRVTLRIDGATLTLESTALSREPAVAT